MKVERCSSKSRLNFNLMPTKTQKRWPVAVALLLSSPKDTPRHPGFVVRGQRCEGQQRNTANSYGGKMFARDCCQAAQHRGLPHGANPRGHHTPSCSFPIPSAQCCWHLSRDHRGKGRKTRTCSPLEQDARTGHAFGITHCCRLGSFGHNCRYATGCQTRSQYVKKQAFPCADEVY